MLLRIADPRKVTSPPAYVVMSSKVSTTRPAPVKGNGEGTAMSRGGDGEAVSIEEAALSLREGVVRSLSGISTIETSIVSLVRKTVSDTLHTGGGATGELVSVVHHVIMGTIGAAEQVGTGLTMSVKSVAKGIVLGVHDVGGDVISASSETMRSVIKQAAAVGSDVGMVAKRAVDGLIEATVEIGGNVVNVGKGAIEGAIDEAGKVSNMAMRTVKEVLNGIVGSSLGEGEAAPSHARARAPAAKQHAPAHRAGR